MKHHVLHLHRRPVVTLLFLCALCAFAPFAPFAPFALSLGSGSVAAQQPADAPALVLGVGDSLMAGVGASIPQRGEYSLFLDLARGRFGPNVRATNVAIPGTTSSTLLAPPVSRPPDPGTATPAPPAVSPTPVVTQIARAQAELRGVPEGASAVVLLSIGGNDLFALRGKNDAAREAALGTFRVNLTTALARLTEDGRTRQILIQTIYDPFGGDPTVAGSDAGWVARFNDALREVARTRPEAVVVELAGAVRGGEDALTLIRYGDIHLSNAGHRLAADLLWTASGADRTPPDVTLVAPVAGNTARAAVTVRAVVTDNSGTNGVGRVALLVDGTDGGELLPRPDLAPNTFLGIWDGRLAPGPHTLGVVATDRAGNRRDVTAAVMISLP